jgi:integrase
MNRKSDAWTADKQHDARVHSSSQVAAATVATGGSPAAQAVALPDGVPEPAKKTGTLLRVFTQDDADASSSGSWNQEPSADMRLSDLYHCYVVPECLAYAKPRHFEEMETSVGYWIRFTLDPPINQIIQLASIKQFVEGLKTLRGRSGKPIAANTIRKHVVHVQSVLDRAGPPSRKRPGAGLMERVPFIPRPSLVINRNIKRFTLAEIGMLLDVTGKVARSPRGLPGVKPRVWWECLGVVGYNIGLPIGALIALEWAWLDQDELGWWFRIPPAADGVKKSRAGRDYYLNRWALAAVERMRPSATREPRAAVPATAGREKSSLQDFPKALNSKAAAAATAPAGSAAAGGTDFSSKVFPWTAAENTLWRTLQRMHAAAEMPGNRRFGFHGLRKACNTELTRINAVAAKMAMGHAVGDVTIDHYTALEIMIEAMEKLPQPPRKDGPQRLLF